MTTWLRVDAGGRWDALALLHALSGMQTYMIQDGLQHWNLYVEREGTSSQVELERRIRGWLVARSLPQTSLSLENGECCVVTAPDRAQATTEAARRKPHGRR